MQRPQHDFGLAVAIDAEAVGQPGRRRFRIMVRSGQQTASIWMEKEQLISVGDWFREMVGKLDQEDPRDEPDLGNVPFGMLFDVEFRAGQIGLGYAEDQRVFTLQAFSTEETNPERPTLRCLLQRRQCRELSRRVVDVVSAGRPICPLCELPIDPEGHVCPRSNGHHTTASI